MRKQGRQRKADPPRSSKKRRAEAERLVSETPDKLEKIPFGDIGKVIHELQVHQIELEMQNDELRTAQREIEAARDRYTDLYDFAPVGYFTLENTGKILGVNLTGASLLGVERRRLINTFFSACVVPSQRRTFHDHVREAIRLPGRRICELQLMRADRSAFLASMESAADLNPQESFPRVRSVLTDITERKKMEEALKESESRCRHLSSQLLTVQEGERKRISQEIHDGIGQSLCAILYRIGKILPNIDHKRRDLKNLVEDLIPLIQTTVEETRRIQLDLRPSLLDDLGILAASEWFCREYERTYPQIRISKDLGIKESEIPDPLKTTIYRILQESLNNVAKHSKAKIVQVSLKKNGALIDLAISDNGAGFDPRKTGSERSKRGLGLASMEERTRLSGGTFRIDSVKGKGTTVRARWPTGTPAGSRGSAS